MNTPTFEAFLNQYGLDRETGFIDSKDPLDRLPQPEYSEWEHLASEAAHLVMMHAFRRMILKVLQNCNPLITLDATDSDTSSLAEG